MNKSIITNLGFVLQTAGILIILPIIFSFYYKEEQASIALLLTSFSFFSIGFMMNALSERKELDFKSSCVLVTLTFFIISLIGAIPYLYLGIFNTGNFLDNFISSYFESISGYTTTGFSLIQNVEGLPKSIILYRSLTQWIGGIGIVYLILAFFYSEGVLNNLLEAIGFRRILSKIKHSMLEVIFIYSIYTIIFFSVLYFLGLKDVVNNLSLIFSSIATGGFSPVSNLLDLGSQIIVLVILMMVFGGTSFYIHHSIFFRRWKNLKSSEFLLFLFIIVSFSTFVYFYFGYDLVTSLFHVTSALTGTGFSFIDVSSLESKLKIIMILLMFTGGCYFSTTAGIKIFRVLVLFKSIGYVIRKKLYGSGSLEIDGKTVTDTDIIFSLLTICVSILIIFASSLIFTFSGYDFINSLFECTSALSNAGLSTKLVSLELSPLLKSLLIILMGIGRVEVMIFLIAVFRFKTLRTEEIKEEAKPTKTLEIEKTKKEDQNLKNFVETVIDF